MPDQSIVEAVRTFFPRVQAIYRFGSCGTADERPDSDCDLALLLPPGDKTRLAVHPLAEQLAALLGREVDLVNLRQVDTVFQKEILAAERRIDAGDVQAADSFEMLVLSYYQRLNRERREILADFRASGRVYES
ncbi:MAG: nucleotidyltransferase domain-containing protein [Magnetococcales bacterium]|nr:nucleotidyltransferase domain-containing protein [Magnetococcales bacterium]